MSDGWKRVKDLFQRAVERDGAARRRLLDRECAGRPGLRREVESLLRAHRDAGDFLAGAAVAAEAEGGRPPPSLEGRRLGHYQVRRLIGEGGVGQVYLAVRADDFHKRVAIKVIRRGMATDDVLRRFRAERQILAGIEHPNIGRLLDGGSTDDGSPYLVMEHIDGVPIDRWADERRLDLGRRLELFRALCRAVAVAHQNLVVHRDIKPGNVLVDREGALKLVDFGVAKILDPAPAEVDPAVTRREHRILTPAYASPEQLRGEPVTTATDVYSLGVLLYELLTGRLPRQALAPGTLAPTSAGDEGPPPRPSDVVGGDAEAAALRSTSPARLRRALAGDLDNIVATALRAEPARRYPSVERLDDDVRRHLAGLPVGARPDTFGYRAAKFVRRHRLPVTLAAVTLVSILAFLAVVALQAAGLARARDRAADEAARSRLVADFLQEVLASPDPSAGPFGGRLGREATVVEALEAAVPRIDAAFGGEPALEAEIRHTLGTTFSSLARYAEARPLLERALELRRGDEDVPAAALADSLDALGRLRHELGELEAAEALYREALAVARRQGDADAPRVARALNRLATVRHDAGDETAAERLYVESLEMRRRLFGAEHRDVATSLDDLANLHHDRGELERAESMYRQALDIRRRLLGGEHPDLAGSLNNVGVVVHDQGRLEEAEELYRESLRLTRRAFGDRHPYVSGGLGNLASLMVDRGRLERAEELCREALAIDRAVLGDAHPVVADQLALLAGVLVERGRPAEAGEALGEAIEILRRAPGDQRAGIALALADLGEAREAGGDLAGAESALREAVELARAALPADDLDAALIEASLADVLLARGEAAPALDLYRRSLAALERAGAGDELVADVGVDHGSCLAALGRVDEALAVLRAARRKLADAVGEDDERTRRADRYLAELARPPESG